MLKKEIQQKRYVIYLVFFLLSILSLVYTHIGREVIFAGDDVFFHLSRIQGIAEGVRNGDLFPKINYFFLYGMGYASPLFYADLWLYPFGFLQAIGVSIIQPSLVFLVVVNFVTYSIAYQCFYYYKKRKRPAVVFAILYGTASYRLSDLTERAAIGELLALVFLPLAFLGLWVIVHKSSNQFYILALGMAGLLLSHVLSAFLFCILIFLYLLASIPLFLKHKERLVTFLKAIGLTILLTIGFLAPLAEQITNQQFYFQINQVARMSETASSVTEYMETALKNSGFNNVGLLIIGLMVFLGINFLVLTKESRLLLGFAFIFFVFSTNLVPHQLLEKTLMNAIQFPWRFFSLVTLLVCWLFSDHLDDFFENSIFTKGIIYGSIGASIVLLVFHNLFLYVPENYMTREAFSQAAERRESLGWGKEYLPADTTTHQLLDEYSRVHTTQEVEIDNIQFDYGKITLDYTLLEDTGEQPIVFPLVYYKGYQVKNERTRFPVYNSPNFPGLCEATLEGSGTLEITYRWTVVQILSFLISLVSWGGVGIKISRDKIRLKS